MGFCLNRWHVGFDVGCIHAMEKLYLDLLFHGGKVVSVNFTI